MTGAVKKIVDKFGGISVLIQNAGRSQRARWEHTQIQVDKDLFELNVFSVVQLTRQLGRRTLCKKCGTGTLYFGKTFSQLKEKGRWEEM
jgi:short-subunit dehydrogenase